MSADKTTPKIGTILDGTEARDAVHIALAPVVANETLSAGTPVGLLPDGSASIGAVVAWHAYGPTLLARLGIRRQA